MVRWKAIPRFRAESGPYRNGAPPPTTMIRVSFPSEADLGDMDLDQMYRAAIRMKNTINYLVDKIEELQRPSGPIVGEAAHRPKKNGA